MSPPMWAYQVENFDPPPDDELVCSVCRSVFCDPVQSTCNHVFCRVCIYKWLENNFSCPICRKRISRHSFKDVVPLVKNMIMKLTLSCHNSETGCFAKISLESCESHVKECPYEMVCCKNKPCKKILVRKDIYDHEKNICPHRYVRCKTCCLKIFLKPDGHNCIKSLKRVLRAKNQVLKKQLKKLKELEDKVKKLERGSMNSDMSYASSISDRDIEIPDDEFFRFSQSFIQDSMDEFEDLDDDFYTPEGLSPNDINDDSIEQPRSETALDEPSSSYAMPELGSETTFAHGFSLSRRPAKRRLPTLLSDSTDDENGVTDSPHPSLKRTTWTARNENQASNHQSGQPSAGPRIPSTENGAIGGHRHKIQSFSSPERQSTSPNTEDFDEPSPQTPQIFARTISLLEQYNLDSDPEWLPVEERDRDSDDEDFNLLSFDGPITSSDESSLSVSSADSDSGSNLSESSVEIISPLQCSDESSLPVSSSDFDSEGSFDIFSPPKWTHSDADTSDSNSCSSNDDSDDY